MAKKVGTSNKEKRSAEGPASQLPAQYEVGMWSGQPQYCCKLCAFDTMIGPATMLDHLVKAHNSMQALEALIALEGHGLQLQQDTQPNEDTKSLLKEGEDHDQSNVN